MSGNPFGLSELSHFGSMQRVGGKAAGFINKKFFHPSSLQNQEKLWKAQTAKSVEERKQKELEKQREEEMQVEALKKQMYLQGQGGSSDFVGSKAAGLEVGEALKGAQKHEQRQAYEEFKRRRAQLKQEKHKSAAAAAAASGSGGASPSAEADESSPASPAPVPEKKLELLAKSQYSEDVHVNGHESVWGSWFSLEDKRWGFSCCKEMEPKKRCPLAPEPEEKDNEPKAKRKRG
mmetsp:Transcript_84375/g.176592  ORF Transcript_84375/g.176592 Transcript_84375/m.176592 type:complete len:234 (-) Transcript_84375:71-772(-)|eukprot:CAMPEP_0206473384 /NCGR_PEP_ID=MMETSP0324_2-20121206/32832_1 /ASSEMBLY_ACC=CAM_ASM_000836 /TAXON_ID=2866 /ORGANISM="Crypthecodinium cohnii, Strain Seligo" /LENGTH=233 /DNA_ID=CAMNT_0053948301 /DNA_START=89 /DNA_END=790 /DNA_ORIENTATION=+